MFVVSIIIDIPLYRSYNYTCLQQLKVGTRVEIEFRGRPQIGFVTNCIQIEQFKDYPLDKLKPVISISPDYLTIPEQTWKICEFASSYYHHPLGATVFAAIPGLMRKRGNPSYNSILDRYYFSSNDSFWPRGKKQQLLWGKIKENKLSHQQITQLLGQKSDQLIEKWLKNGYIQEVEPPPVSDTVNMLIPNQEQQLIISEVSKQLGNYHTGLLYGITGSGKTEVFLQLIAKVLANKQQVLVLVPEINLTPQLATRFSNRFPHANICLLNSEISDKQRFNTWVAAQKGEYQIILGTRLAVFTPCKDLGLIIVDEEHDNSFKQNDSLRYHARDLAIWRAKQLNIPALLSSATPSLESLYNFKIGKYTLYKLSYRANLKASLPKINLINLQHYPANIAGISQPALEELNKCLERKEMALIFINRRGYAPIISCYDCGWVSTCRYCSTKMVYHHDKKQLQCHHCGYHIPVPTACPQCQNQYLHTIGHGTQRLEQFICEYFPGAQIKRVDRDTTNSKSAWNEIYQQINEDKVDILIGTQMLAKGHDFANLTLVIGLNLDTALYSYDFRASEEMFSTLTQVAGRAGRADKPGQVLLQTSYPDHPIYRYLQQHDFNGFINYTLKERKKNQLPPFSHYGLIRLSDNDQTKLKLALKDLKRLSHEIPALNVTVFNPVESVIPKLHNKFRGQMLVMSSQRLMLHHYLEALALRLTELKVTSAIDVDPFEI